MEVHMIRHYLSVALLNFRKAPVATPANVAVLSLGLTRPVRKPIELNALPFIAGLLATLSIAWLAVGAQTLRAARTVPARVLRQE
jgi:hypothetical protein